MKWKKTKKESGRSLAAAGGRCSAAALGSRRSPCWQLLRRPPHGPAQASSLMLADMSPCPPLPVPCDAVDVCICTDPWFAGTFCHTGALAPCELPLLPLSTVFSLCCECERSSRPFFLSIAFTISCHISFDASTISRHSFNCGVRRDIQVQ